MSTNASQARILIVDDDSTNRSLLEARLNFAGYQNVALADSGQRALELTEIQLPDLILLDIMMPGIDGFVVTQEIRARYPDNFIPIILVSALRDVENRIKGIEYGANDFLSKPFNSDELVARVHSLLTLKQARDDLDAERERMSLLYNVSQTLNAKLEMGHLLRQITSLTTELTGANKALFVELDQEGSFVQKVIARRDEEPRSADRINSQVLDRGLIGWVIRNREPAFIQDVSSDERWTQLTDDDEPAYTALAVPLLRGEAITGVLLLVSSEEGVLEPDDLDLLNAIAIQAAFALENAHLYETARRERARVEALLDQTGDPVVVTDDEGRITSFNPAAAKLLHLDGSCIGLLLRDCFSFALEDLLVRARERGSAISGEYSARSNLDDQRATFNVSVSPVEGVGYILVWQDITSLKEAELVRLESERIEKRRLLDALMRYMSPTIAERVLSDPLFFERRERRDAVVLFADLRGFTRLTVENSPDKVMELLNDVFAEMQTTAYEHEGVVFDIAGDELMIAFNVPYDQPDASLRALGTAIAMQRRFRQLRSKWAGLHMHVGLGIGVNRGAVVIGHTGGSNRLNYAMVGETVNVAHRLVELAEDGQIVVTPEVLEGAQLNETDLMISELAPQTLKGTNAPQAMVLIQLVASPTS